MRALAQLRSAFRSLFRRDALEQELDDELRFHLEQQTAANLRAGLEPAEAARQARIQLGGTEQVKEEVRALHLGIHLDALWQDLRYGARLLAKRPGFTLVAVLTLALGIGANTALFSLVHGVLLTPLPYPEPDHLVQVWETNPENSLDRIGPSTGDIVEWRRRNRVFDGIAGWYVMGRTLRTESQAQIVSVAQVSADFFPVLGIEPFLGRTFTAEETAASTFNSAAGPTGADPVVILSHSTWRQHFGADPNVIGRKLSLERQEWRIVGVMPAGFAFPAPEVALWIPWSFQGNRPHDQRYLRAIARLKPGTALLEAQRQMDAVTAAMARAFPETNQGWGVHLVALHTEVVGNSRLALLVLLAAVACLLLVACVNLASLQLARATERSGEMAVRLSLGASRSRLARQLFSESLLLALLGAGLGVLVALGGLELLKALSPPEIPRLQEVALSPPVLAFTFALMLLAGIVSGLAPALTGSRVDLNEALKAGTSRVHTAGQRTLRLRSLLVGAQVALAVVLLSAAGLLVRSLAQLHAVDPGFNPKNVLVLPIFLDVSAYNGAKSLAYYAQLTEKLAAVPGVVAAGGATALPASPLGPDFDRPVWWEQEPPPPGGLHTADVRMVTPDYFRTLGIRVLRGRAFSPQDKLNSPHVVIVNQTLAQRLWRAADPIGQRLVVDYSRAGTYPYQVVGVVNDVRFRGLRSQPRPEIYFPHAQRPYLVMNVAVRTSIDPTQLIPQVRQVVLEMDPAQPPHSIRPLEELVGATIERDRFATFLLSGFALAALGLGLVGIVGLLSYQVSRRHHEIGIRLALGARPRDVFEMILAFGLGRTLAGMGAGVLLALIATRWLSGLLFGITPTDPLTFLLVLGVLLVVAALACALPATRAARVDPMTALRYE